MKVLHVIDTLNIGGAEKVFLDITTLLVEAGIEVDALIFNDIGPWRDHLNKHVKLHVLNRGNKYSLAKIYELHRVCKKYDIVHAHMIHCYRYVRLAQFIFHGKYKIILHDHGSSDFTGENYKLLKGLKYLFKPKSYIGVSNQRTERIVAELKLKKEDTHIIRNTVVIRNIPRHKLNDDNKKKIIIVSNVRPVKNLEFAIELFEKLGWQLTIYGNKTEGNLNYFNKIVEEIKGRKIEIIEDISDFSDIYPNYGMAIHCSKSESGPLVLLEYMANGIPFLAYQTGEIANVLQKEIPEFFIQSFDIDEWIERIELIIDRYDDLTSRFQEILNKHFDNKKYIEECLEIYRKLSS